MCSSRAASCVFCLTWWPCMLRLAHCTAAPGPRGLQRSAAVACQTREAGHGLYKLYACGGGDLAHVSADSRPRRETRTAVAGELRRMRPIGYQLTLRLARLNQRVHAGDQETAEGERIKTGREIKRRRRRGRRRGKKRTTMRKTEIENWRRRIRKVIHLQRRTLLIQRRKLLASSVSRNWRRSSSRRRWLDATRRSCSAASISGW
mmetsp:Transcript_10921/g.18997  ORF Transcript_10921/g.18997 Transcript_10921/m.18997 type:complete len:205 (+) Transcript_10921:1-615(+)